MSESDDEYQPIACGLYEGYELAIMHRQRLRLTWLDPQGMTHLDAVVPKDLRTQAGAEYLIALASSGSTLKIRLDLIRECTPL